MSCPFASLCPSQDIDLDSARDGRVGPDLGCVRSSHNSAPACLCPYHLCPTCLCAPQDADLDSAREGRVNPDLCICGLLLCRTLISNLRATAA